MAVAPRKPPRNPFRVQSTGDRFFIRVSLHLFDYLAALQPIVTAQSSSASETAQRLRPQIATKVDDYALGSCPASELSAVDDRDRPGPACGSALDLYRKTRHHEAGRRQLLEIMQFLDVAIADV